MTYDHFSCEDGYVQHENLYDETVECREYQVQLAETSLKESTLVALPTGGGKTIISVLVAAEMRRRNPNEPILFLAPKKSLVTQQKELFKDLIDEDDDLFVELTGDIRPENRSYIYYEEDAEYLFATPGVIENDIIDSTLDVSQFSMVVFDECHRGTGDYAYTFIGEEYQEYRPDGLTLGLSASPGTSEEKVLEICDPLGFKNIEILSPDDPLITDHIYTPNVTEEWLEMDDEIQKMQRLVGEVLRDRVETLKEEGYLDTVNPSQYDYSDAHGKIQSEINSGNSDAYGAMSLYAECRKLEQALSRIETQSVSSFLDYLQKQKEDAKDDDSSRAVQRMMSDDKIREAYKTAMDYSNLHPKKEFLQVLLFDAILEGKQAIVFAQNVDTVYDIVDFINSIDGFLANPLVGQSNMKQSEQQETIEEFRRGEFDVLVSTSVAEEGLDIPATELVVFYEPVGNPLRAIQRRGRTARGREGEVVVMIGKDTQDEGEYYKSKHREESMEEELTKLSEKEESIQELLDDQAEQSGLSDFSEETETDDTTEDSDAAEDTETDDRSDLEVDTEESLEQGSDLSEEQPQVEDDDDDVQIIMDNRELKSTIGRLLYHMDDIETTKEQLDVGDFILGPETAVERKTLTDFLDTISGDRSIFEQIGDLVNSYDRAILLLECPDGNLNPLYERGVPENAVRGMLDSLINQFGVELIPTVGEEDSAEWLATIARRSQQDSDRTVQSHGNKQTQTLADQQRYIVSSIEGIGDSTAELLLEHFGTVQDVFTATTEELEEIDGIGEKTATRIHTVLRETYTPEQ